jgi:hypothetical protein
MFDDFKDLLSAFNARGVKYLIVGGYAVSFHAQPRATKDLDLFIWADEDNARAAYSALSAFGVPLDGISVSDLADPSRFIRFGREPVAVDILSGIDGVSFEEAWPRRVEGIVDPRSGLSASFISREDLIQSKLVAGRLRDLADVEAIRAAIQGESERVQPTTPESDKPSE